MSNFETIGRANTRSRSGYVALGQLKLSSYGLYFGPLVYEGIGAPIRIGLEVDRKNKLIRLLPTEEGQNFNSWKPAKHWSRSFDSSYYRLRVMKSELLRQMPRGIYYSAGNGVYAFNEQKNNQ